MELKIEDIVSNELCTGCGVCVSESVGVQMVFDEKGFLIPKSESLINSNAVKVCPFNSSPDDEVKDEDVIATEFLGNASFQDEKIGRYQNLYVGYSNEFRPTSSSGGLATYVFYYLLKEKIVDHLFIVKEVNGAYQYQWFSDCADIVKLSKTRYIPVTLENLFKEIDKRGGKIAISGVACFVKAIRLKQHYYPKYKEKIPFVVGIICGGLKSKHYSDFLAQKSGIEKDYNRQDYRIKDKNSNATDYSFGAYDSSENFHQVKMNTLGDMWCSGLFKSRACDFCDDVTTELADISLGDAWLQPYVNDGMGNSVIVTRTKLADEIIKHGISSDELYIEKLTLEEFKQSQQGSFNHRHKALKYRIDKSKKEGKLVPNNRQRLFVSISFQLKTVQKLRMKVRALSHIVWNKHKNAVSFEKEMKPLRDKLYIATLLNHRLRKIKRILLNKIK